MVDFKIHILKGVIENILLAEYPEKILLLDGGSRPDARLIEEFFQQKLQRPVTDIKLMVVTHMHPDHAGAAPLLRKKYNIPIAAHPNADNWYKGIGGNTQHLIDTALAHYVSSKQPAGKRTRMWYPAKLHPNYLLTENSPLPYFNDWVALETPGHTAHDLSLWNASQQTMYVADIVLQVKQKCMLPFPVTLPLLMQNSLDKLSKYPIKTLLLAHGGVCTNFKGSDTFLALKANLWQNNKPLFRLLEPLSRLSHCVRKSH